MLCHPASPVELCPEVTAIIGVTYCAAKFAAIPVLDVKTLADMEMLIMVRVNHVLP